MQKFYFNWNDFKKQKVTRFQANTLPLVEQHPMTSRIQKTRCKETKYRKPTMLKLYIKGMWKILNHIPITHDALYHFKLWLQD